MAKQKKVTLPSGIPPFLLERVGFLLNKAAQRIREITEESLKPFGLTGRHLGILAVIREKGALPQLEIGKCAHVDRTTMVQVVDDLERVDLVVRRENPSDRRAHSLVLTPKGKKVFPQAAKLGLKAEKKFLSYLSVKDKKDLARILKHLVLAHFGQNQ